MDTIINLSKSLKKICVILILTVLLANMFPASASADGKNPASPETNISLNSKTVPTDPDRPLSPEEKKFRDAKYRALNQFIEQINKSRGTIYGGIPASKTLAVGIWKEPNKAAYVNHCGPGATQVALDARWPAWKVYKIDRIARDEKTNVGGTGTNMSDIYTTINSDAYLGTEFPNPNGMEGYWLDRAQNAADLFYKASFDISHGYALITGVMTGGMPGWGKYDAPHIVSVIGYKYSGIIPQAPITASTSTTLTYTDTAPRLAGFTGRYRNTVKIAEFFGFVSRLNTLIW